MFNFLNKCKHEYQIVAVIGGDTQNYAKQCTKCGNKKVEVHGINGKADFDDIVKNGRKSYFTKIRKSKEGTLNG